MTLYDVANCLNLAQQNAPMNYPTQDGHAALALIGLYRWSGKKTEPECLMW